MNNDILQQYARVAWAEDLNTKERSWIHTDRIPEHYVLLDRIERLRYELEAQINGDNPDMLFEVRAYRIKYAPTFYDALFKVFQHDTDTISYIRIREYYERTSSGNCVGFWNLIILD